MDVGQRKVTIVTGASSGIGAEAARLFADRGDNLVLAARRIDRLEILAEELKKMGVDALPVQCDLSDPKTAARLIDSTMDRFGRIDVLVNNAGFGSQVLFETMGYDEIVKMFNVNVLSLMEITRLAVPIMRKQKKGNIVNVASVGGIVPHPLNVAYCASKFAVVGFSRSLRLELKGTGVNVSVVCPAATQTEFFDVAQGEVPFHKMIFKTAVPAKKVAAAIVKSSRSNKGVVYPTFSARVLTLLEKTMPFLVEWGNVKYRDKVLPK